MSHFNKKLYLASAKHFELNSGIFKALKIFFEFPAKMAFLQVQEFEKYVKNAYMHWLQNFKKFVHIKSSLHLTLGHVAQLIARNEGYTLAGVSENSFENWIKAYKNRDTTNTLWRGINGLVALKFYLKKIRVRALILF